MLGKFLTLNGTTLPNPVKWNETHETVENSKETEAGTTATIVTRYDKLSVSASFQCSSGFADQLKALSETDTLTMELKGDTKASRLVMLRNFKKELVQNSERNSNTNGLWEVSLDILEV